MKNTKTATNVSNKKVLVVDDDPKMINLLSTLLTRDGYEVLRADYSLPALFRVVKHAPDLILADVHMPMMDGLELLRQFKTHRDTRHIPVFIVTAFDDPETRVAAREAGCAAFIPKPIDMARLREKLAEYLPPPCQGTKKPLKDRRKQTRRLQ